MEGEEIRGNMWWAAIRVCQMRFFVVPGTALRIGPSMSIYCSFSTLLHSWKRRIHSAGYLCERPAMFVVLWPHESSVCQVYDLQNACESQISGKHTYVQSLTKH